MSDDEQKLSGPKKLLVCNNFRFGSDVPSCGARGADRLLIELRSLLAKSNVTVPIEVVRCLGRCPHGPVMRTTPAGDFFYNVSHDTLPEIVEALETEFADLDQDGEIDPLKYLSQ